MTSIDVNDVLKRTQSTANGSTTDFSFSFQVNNTNEIKVYEDSTLKTEGTHYDIVDSSASAGLNANGTGVVKFKTSPTDYTPANNKVITILSVMSIARSSVYSSGGNITAASLEADFDRLHRVVGDFREVKSRTLIAPEYSPTDIDMTIPSKASRLGKILGFNSSTGNPEMFTYLTNDNVTALDGLTAGTVSASKYVLVDANKDIGTFRNITLSGELDAGSLDISGNADIDGTLEADAITVDGTALNEYIADTVGAMVGSNTETGVTVSYEDGDNTLDFVLGASQDVFTSILNTSLVIGRDADNQIKFSTDNQIIFEVDGGDNVIFKTGGEIEASSLDISGNADIDGTLEADAITIEGTALNEYIADTVGAMVGSNTETGISVTYEDADNTLDFVIGSTSITNGMLAGSIADTKLDTITSAGKVSIGALEIDGASDIGADLADADLIIVDDGAGGTEVKSELTRVKKYIYSAMSGDATVSDAGALTIAIDAVESGMLNDNIISGQTAITSGLASTDELLFSDAGTIKKMDVSVLTDYYKDLTVTETNKTLTSPKINEDVALTSTATELNLLDGVSGLVQADFTKLAAIDATATELNLLDGITGIADEDNMSSNSNTKLATQQSIKAYVDAQVTASDLDFQGDSGGALSIDLDSETLDIAGGTGIDTSGSSNTLTVAIDSTVATLSGSQTLTNKTIDVDNNTVSNIEVDNLKSGVLDTSLSSVSGSDDTLASAKAIKAYVDANAGGGGMSNFILEDGDGTEVTVADGKEVKFVEGGGLDINWTDTSTGSDGDPYDLTFTINASQTDITSLTNASLVIGRDADNDIDFATDNEIIFRANGADQIKLSDGALVPVTDNDIDLGTSSLEFKNLYLDGTAYVDGISCVGIITNTGDIKNTGYFWQMSDAQYIYFGANFEVSLRHVHNTGLLLNSDNVFQFRDADINIGSPADGYLDINADTEIELNSTLIDINGNLDVSGSLTLGGTAITSTASELNILDGVTATASELNIMDGVTSTTAELNILDGVTATASELNIMDGVTASTAELNIMDGVTATTAELNYVDGVTSNIQTQLDAIGTGASKGFATAMAIAL